MSVVGEYLKLAYYVLRFTHAGYWIAGCVLVAVAGLACGRFRGATA